MLPYPTSQEPENRGSVLDSEDLCHRLVMLKLANKGVITIIYLTADVFEVCHASISCPHWAVHRLECFACVISGDALFFDVIEQVLDQVHLGEVPRILLIRLLVLNSQ